MSDESGSAKSWSSVSSSSAVPCNQCIPGTTPKHVTVKLSNVVGLPDYSGTYLLHNGPCDWTYIGGYGQVCIDVAFGTFGVIVRVQMCSGNRCGGFVTKNVTVPFDCKSEAPGTYRITWIHDSYYWCQDGSVTAEISVA